MRSFLTLCLRTSLVVLGLWLPLLASAHAMPLSQWAPALSGRALASSHLISVTATTPFVSEIAASDSASAIYTVTNISTIPLTGISTQLVAPSAFSIQSATCSPTTALGVGDSCTVTLSLQAPGAVTTLSGTLNEGALPSIDGVYADVGPVHVNAPLTVTSSAGSNGSVSPTTASVAYGGDQAFTATPSTGYSVNQWLLDGSVVQTGGSSYTLSNITANHAVSVSFATAQYTVTASAGSNGSVSPATTSVAYGGSQVFTATPSTGYSVNQWLVDGLPAQTGGTTYTLSNITANHTVSVSFAINTYTVTASAGGNGSVSPTTATVAYNNSQVFTATPSTGYGVYQWLVDGALAQTGGTTYNLSNVTANQTVSVSFAINTYTVTPSAGSNGGINPDSAQTVSYGGSQVFTATPNALYSVNQWLVDGEVMQTGGTSYTLSNVTANQTVSVSFYRPLMVAVGFAALSGSPKIVASLDKGATWADKNYGVIFSGGAFYDTACTGVELNSVCTAVGQGDDGNDARPILARSGDNGVTWSVVSIPVSTTDDHQLNTTSCVGSGGTAYCLAAGGKTGATFDTSPILIESSNGGQNWASVSLTSILGGTLVDSSCTGTNDNNRCVVIGKTSTTGGPLLLIGTEQGSNWDISPALASFTNLVLNKVSCTGDGNSAVCVAAGKDNNAPFVALSTDGGTTWSRQTINNDLPAAGEFKGGSCTGSGLNVICSVAGVNTTDSRPMLRVMSTSSGTPVWTKPTLPAGDSGITLTTTSCTGSGSTALCTAAGQDLSGGTGWQLQSTDGGATWAHAPITMPGFVDLLGSHCSVNQAMCTTVGNTILQTATAGDAWSEASGLGTVTLYASSGT